MHGAGVRPCLDRPRAVARRAAAVRGGPTRRAGLEHAPRRLGPEPREPARAGPPVRALRCRSAQLAAACGVTEQTTSRVVARMERTGYVTRTPHADDRRRHVLSITDAGRAALAVASDRAPAEAMVTRGLTAEEVAELRRLLALVARPRDRAGARRRVSLTACGSTSSTSARACSPTSRRGSCSARCTPPSRTGRARTSCCCASTRTSTRRASARRKADRPVDGTPGGRRRPRRPHHVARPGPARRLPDRPAGRAHRRRPLRARARGGADPHVRRPRPVRDPRRGPQRRLVRRDADAARAQGRGDRRARLARRDHARLRAQLRARPVGVRPHRAVRDPRRRRHVAVGGDGPSRDDRRGHAARPRAPGRDARAAAGLRPAL